MNEALYITNLLGTHMWIVFAFGLALFASLTAILAKCGIKTTDSDVATVLQTIVVLIVIAFSAIVFHERLTKKAAIGLVLLVTGTLLMLV